MQVRALNTLIQGGLEVVSLTTGKDGKIYGGLTGAKDHLLYEYDPKTDRCRDVGGQIVSNRLMFERNGRPYSQKIHHALSTLPDGQIAGATGQNVSFGTMHRRIRDDDGGRVFVFNPRTGQSRDLGIPIPNMWIINSTTSSDGRWLFGMTYFHNDFFVVDLQTGAVVFADQVHAGVWGDSACCHTIVCDAAGIVYGSCSEGYLFYYDSHQKKLVETDVKLPGEGSCRIDSLVIGEDGLIYGGTWETGILFSVEPGSLKIKELARPNVGPRLPALVAWDGKIFGAAGGGEQYGTRGAFLFEYDPRTGRCREIGPLVDKAAGVTAQRVHALTVGLDGVFYAGETGATGTALQVNTGDIVAGMNPYMYIIRI